jgi:hypothetical protein
VKLRWTIFLQFRLPLQLGAVRSDGSGLRGTRASGGGGQRGSGEDRPKGLPGLFGLLRANLLPKLLPLLLQIAYIRSKAGVLEG